MTNEGKPKGMIGSPCPRLSWTIVLVSGIETLQTEEDLGLIGEHGGARRSARRSGGSFLVRADTRATFSRLSTVGVWAEEGEQVVGVEVEEVMSRVVRGAGVSSN